MFENLTTCKFFILKLNIIIKNFYLIEISLLLFKTFKVINTVITSKLKYSMLCYSFLPSNSTIPIWWRFDHESLGSEQYRGQHLIVSRMRFCSSGHSIMSKDERSESTQVIGCIRRIFDEHSDRGYLLYQWVVTFSFIFYLLV